MKLSSIANGTIPVYLSQRALEVLEKEANLRGNEENDRRALAFRKGMTTLASYPKPVRSLREVKGLPNIGKHIERVIQVYCTTVL